MTGVSQRAPQTSRERIRKHCILQNRVVFYKQDAVFGALAIPKRIQTITIPEEGRRKQRNIRPYNSVIASVD